jgi:hypothetical protein
MFTATPTTRQQSTAPRIEDRGAQDVIETRLWLEEHDWLYRLLRSADNVSPTFRFPDLISASVSLVFSHEGAPARIFKFLGTELVLRSPKHRAAANRCGGTSTSCCWICNVRPLTGTPTPSSSSTS